MKIACIQMDSQESYEENLKEMKKWIDATKGQIISSFQKLLIIVEKILRNRPKVFQAILASIYPYGPKKQRLIFMQEALRKRKGKNLEYFFIF